MKQKTCLLTFDLEEFVPPKEMNLPYDEKYLFDISVSGLEILHVILKESNIHTTFFTTKTFAQQPRVHKIIKELLQEGHEIALHGNDHMDIYRNMPSQELSQNLSEAKEYLQKTFDITIIGFRAPRLQKVPLELLQKLGIHYDASLHPTIVPGHYYHFFASRKIREKNEIKIVPISVTPLVRAPFSWFWFRNFGLRYAKVCTFFNFMNSPFVHLYFHPWDFYNFASDQKKWHIHSSFFRNTDKAPAMLKAYIQWLKKKHVSFSTIQNYLHKYSMM